MDWKTTNLNFQQINIFLTIMEEGNFAQAAETLFLSNSTISKNITRMEKEFGFELFTRNTRAMTPTPMAEILYDSWKSALQEIKGGYEKAKNESERDSCTLNIGIPNTSNPQRYLWPKTQYFLADYPDTLLNVSSRNWTDLIGELREGIYDVIFIPDFDVFTLDEFDMPWTYVARSRAEAIIPGNHSLRDRESLTMSDILDESLIVYDKKIDPNFIRWLEDIYAKYDSKPLIGMYTGNIFAGQSYSLTDSYILIGDHYFQFSDDMKCKRIPIEDLEDGIIISWNNDLKKEIALSYIEYMRLM